MKRIDTTSAAADLNGPGKNGFTEGNPSASIPPTRLNSRFFNNVQEELCNVIESENILVNDSTTQMLLNAITSKLAKLRMAVSLGSWFSQSPAGGYVQAFRNIINANSQWVAVGDSGGCQTSVDAINWTSRTFAASYTGSAHGIVWTGSTYVAAGSGAMLQTSPDAITWTSRTPGSAFAGNFFSIAYGGSLAVTCGSNCEIQTSTPTGVTWTHRAAPWADSFSLTEAHYAPWGIYYVCGDNGRIASSPDGVTWTQRLNGSLGTSQLNSIAGGTLPNTTTNIMVAVGNGGLVVRSTDLGVTWSVVSGFSSSATLFHVAWNGTYFVISGSNGPSVGASPFYISANGLNWKQVYAPTPGSVNASFYDSTQNYTVAVGQGGYLGRSGQVVDL